MKNILKNVKAIENPNKDENGDADRISCIYCGKEASVARKIGKKLIAKCFTCESSDL